MSGDTIYILTRSLIPYIFGEITLTLRRLSMIQVYDFLEGEGRIFDFENLFNSTSQ